MIEVLLATEDEERRGLVERALGELDDHGEISIRTREGLSESEDVERYAKELLDREPLIVLLDATTDGIRALDVAGEIDRLRADVGLIVFSEQNADILQRALRSGVRELVPPSTTVPELAEAIQRVHEIASRRRAERQLDDHDTGGRIITVVSPKGGAGKTMLATNLAVGLAKASPRDVVLVDLDLQFGDVANALRMVPDRTIGDTVAGGIADITALKLDLTSHPSGLFALCAPDDPGIADDITAQHVIRILQLLAQAFSYVVVDTDPGLGEHTLAAIEQATDIIFICATDVASVRGLNKELVALDRIGMTTQQRHFVLNRADAKVGLSADDIGSTVSMPVDVFVPSSRSVPLAMNQGLSLLEGDVQSPLTNPLWGLVKRFANVTIETDGAVEPRGFLRRR